MDRGILDATWAAQSKAAGRLLDSADVDLKIPEDFPNGRTYYNVITQYLNNLTRIG